MTPIIVTIPNENKIAFSFPHYVCSTFSINAMSDVEIKQYIKNYICEEIDKCEIKIHKEEEK